MRRSRRGKKYEAIAQAKLWHETASRCRDMMESMILAGMPSADIAKELEISAPAVDAYEALFFQVRDRLKCNPFWVQARISGHEQRHQPLSLGPVAKHLSYHGGPAAAIALNRLFPEEDFRLCLEEADLVHPARVTIKIAHLSRQPGAESLRLIHFWRQIRELLKDKAANSTAESVNVETLMAKLDGLGPANQVHNLQKKANAVGSQQSVATEDNANPLNLAKNLDESRAA